MLSPGARADDHALPLPGRLGGRQHLGEHAAPTPRCRPPARAGRSGSAPRPATTTRSPTRRRDRSVGAPVSWRRQPVVGQQRRGRAGANTSGSQRRSHRSFVMVKLATGTLPHALAHAPGTERGDQLVGVGRRLGVVPQLGRAQHLAGGVERDQTVLLAGDGDRRRAVAAERRPPRRRPSRRPPTSRRGSCSLRGGVVGGCGARPAATSSPVSASRTSTLHAEVDESTPATSGISARRAAARSRAGRGARGRSPARPARPRRRSRRERPRAARSARLS